MSLFKKKVTFTDDRSIGRSILEFIGELVQIIVIVLAIVVPIRYFLFQPFYVKGASMEPNFYDHEYLIVDEISYRFRKPVRGEIVVFRYPNDTSQFFIKRVIGLPGERIEIENGKIKIFNIDHPNGVILNEPYLLEEETVGNKKVDLGSDQYFLLGDNRFSSLDSRVFGPVRQKYIKGRVILRGWPFTKIKWFQIPQYNI